MKRQRTLFLKQNYVLRILKGFMFAGLYLIALLLILVHKVDLGLLSGVTQSVFFITAPVIRLMALPADAISYGYKKVSDITRVYEQNEHLKKENDELFLLKDKLKALKAENNVLKQLLNHINVPETRYCTARVIAQNGGVFTNSLIIYIGDSAPQIKPGYAVVSSTGLIGRIDIVSGRYARVNLITDINSKIPVISAKSRDRGILIGANQHEMQLIFTPLLSELHKGDILVTSGVGGGIPADIPVARITKANTETITAVPLFTPEKLEIVKIIIYDVLPDEKSTKELLE